MTIEIDPLALAAAYHAVIRGRSTGMTYNQIAKILMDAHGAVIEHRQNKMWVLTCAGLTARASGPLSNALRNWQLRAEGRLEDPERARPLPAPPPAPAPTPRANALAAAICATAASNELLRAVSERQVDRDPFAPSVPELLAKAARLAIHAQGGPADADENDFLDACTRYLGTAELDEATETLSQPETEA